MLKDVIPGISIQVKVVAFHGEIPGVSSAPIVLFIPIPANNPCKCIYDNAKPQIKTNYKLM